MGGDRIEMLRSLFEELQGKGITLIVLTKGYVGAVRLLLKEEGLLDYFDTVIGFTGSHYGETEYDEDNEEAITSLEGVEKNALKGTKAEHITATLEKEDLKAREALLV